MRAFGRMRQRPMAIDRDCAVSSSRDRTFAYACDGSRARCATAIAPLPSEYLLLCSSIETKSCATSAFITRKQELGAIATARAMVFTPIGSSATASSRSIDATLATAPRAVGAADLFSAALGAIRFKVFHPRLQLQRARNYEFHDFIGAAVDAIGTRVLVHF